MIAGTGIGSGNIIKGNYIGTNISGNSSVANYDSIKVTKATNTTIAYNLINSVNTGIYALSSVGSNISGINVDNNKIGSNLDATAVAIDSTYGIIMFGSAGSTISNSEITNNTIVGSVRGAGIYIYGTGVNNALIRTNLIGTNSSLQNLANKIGIQVLASNAIGNVIGGDNPSVGNTISFNSTYGVYLSGTQNFMVRRNIISMNGNDGVAIIGNSNAVGNTIIENSIYDNEGIGINLRTATDDKVTYNDPGDLDSTQSGDGPNNLQNNPVLLKAEIEGFTVRIYGAFQSRVDKFYRFDFYSNEFNDDSGFGEGENYFHTIEGISGDYYDFSENPIEINGVVIPAEHKYISVTATECSDSSCGTVLSTSEFGLTGFDGYITGKNLSIDNENPSNKKIYIAAEGIDEYSDVFAFDVLEQGNLSLNAGFDTPGLYPLAVASLDSNHYAVVGYGNTDQYRVYSIIEGYKCAYNIENNTKATEIKVAKNAVGSRYVYVLSERENSELTIFQGLNVSTAVPKYGEYHSEVRDMGTPVPYYHSITWDETRFNGQIKLQLRSSNSSNMANEEWYGPDGTRGSFFVLQPGSTGDVVPRVIQGKRYLQYRIFIESDQLQSPSLDAITIRYGN